MSLIDPLALCTATRICIGECERSSVRVEVGL